MGIGIKIINAAIRKRNEYLKDRKIHKQIREKVDAATKKEAQEAYRDQYEASRKSELIEKAQHRAYKHAHQPSGFAKVTSGAASVGKAGKTILNAMPTVSNPDDPFHMGIGSQRGNRKKTASYTMNDPFHMKDQQGPQLGGSKGSRRKKKKQSQSGIRKDYFDNLP